MYAIYKQKKYDAELRLGKDVTLYSYVKEEGFEKHVDPWGRESDTFFSKKMDIHELDYLYEIEYEIQYKGNFFDVMSVMKRKLIDKDLFVLNAGIEKYPLIEKLGFEVYDKGQWWEKIGRKDIEAIKINEEPEGIFKDQGLKIKILKEKDIDDFLASVKD